MNGSGREQVEEDSPSSGQYKSNRRSVRSHNRVDLVPGNSDKCVVQHLGGAVTIEEIVVEGGRVTIGCFDASSEVVHAVLKKL